MANPSTVGAPSPPYFPVPPTEIHPLVRFLHDRNRALAVENERLFGEYEALKKDIIYKETVVSWQHRQVVLGEEHIGLLETIIRGQPEEAPQPTILQSDEAGEFRPKACSSPLTTPPGLALQTHGSPLDPSMVMEQPEGEQERAMHQDGQLYWPLHN